MSKFHVAFDIDLDKICPDDLKRSDNIVATAETLVSQMLLEFARKSAIKDLQEIRQQDLPQAAKTSAMALCLNRAKLALQAEANMVVTTLPDHAVVRTDTPDRESLAA